jgi:hypothetical protein
MREPGQKAATLAAIPCRFIVSRSHGRERHTLLICPNISLSLNLVCRRSKYRKPLRSLVDRQRLDPHRGTVRILVKRSIFCFFDDWDAPPWPVNVKGSNRAFGRAVVAGADGVGTKHQRQMSACPAKPEVQLLQRAQRLVEAATMAQSQRAEPHSHAILASSVARPHQVLKQRAARAVASIAAPPPSLPHRSAHPSPSPGALLKRQAQKLAVEMAAAEASRRLRSTAAMRLSPPIEPPPSPERLLRAKAAAVASAAPSVAAPPPMGSPVRRGTQQLANGQPCHDPMHGPERRLLQRSVAAACTALPPSSPSRPDWRPWHGVSYG